MIPTWQNELAATQPAWIQDHVVGGEFICALQCDFLLTFVSFALYPTGVILVPGVSYVESFTAAGSSIFGGSGFELRDVRFMNAFTMQRDEMYQIQVEAFPNSLVPQFEVESSGVGQKQSSTLPGGDGSKRASTDFYLARFLSQTVTAVPSTTTSSGIDADKWTLNARALLHRTPSGEDLQSTQQQWMQDLSSCLSTSKLNRSSCPAFLTSLKETCHLPYSIDVFYEHLAKCGFNYGPTFYTVHEAWVNEDVSAFLVHVGLPLPGGPGAYQRLKEQGLPEPLRLWFRSQKRDVLSACIPVSWTRVCRCD